MLTESGLEQFYDLTRHPGVRVQAAPARADWTFLDQPSLQAKLLDFTDGKTSRITLSIPAIHCIACVWLLENLFRLLPGIGKSQVNFPRREVSISFYSNAVKLSRIITLLVSIGYEPELNLGKLEKSSVVSAHKKQWLQIGLSGFAFGNIMLFSLPAYLGLDRFSGPIFKSLFGYLGLILAAPVLVYSAADYWRSAWTSIRQKMLTLDVPIALGLAALYAQSVFEVLSKRGEGYADSLAGLVFFLLCGRAFQQKTHHRIAFDRDYKSFFPLAVTRKSSTGEQTIDLASLQIGDRLLVRNGELIPADSRLVTGNALIDYSFVTGESEPAPRQQGEYLYAGGQQVGGSIEVETVKPVSQSYLTSLWNDKAFRKERAHNLNTLTNRYSRRFTRLVILVASGAALFWACSGAPGRGVKAFTSVLIVACPCALALAAPFALGTAQRLLARQQIFLKNAQVLEQISQVDAIVFDKTGTLTSSRLGEVSFHSFADGKSPATAVGTEALTAEEIGWVRALTVHSAHPHSRRISDFLANSQLAGETPALPGESQPCPLNAVLEFAETPGRGLSGRIDDHHFQLGSREWIESNQIDVPKLHLPPGSISYLAINNRVRGAFVLANALRPQIEQLFTKLAQRCELTLLSGDNQKERARFSGFFGGDARLHFHQSPADKLGFVRRLKESGRTVMMVGDGLNDAGALKQSDVGVAVVEKIGIFSPASDVILEASQLPHLCRVLNFARSSTLVVRASFGISAIYNLIGVSIASAGILSPLICAVLMPLSSISVVLFACGMTNWAARRGGIPLRPAPSFAIPSCP